MISQIVQYSFAFQIYCLMGAVSDHYYKKGICIGVPILMGKKRTSFSSEYFCTLPNLSALFQINSIFERKVRFILENKWLVYQLMSL